MNIPRLLVFASGEAHPDHGGSGFKKLVEASQTGILNADIVGVVSNHAQGGVYTKAKALGIPFAHSPKGRTASDYQQLVKTWGADFVALSGWLGLVEGLPPEIVFNIHPAIDLKNFGGKGYHGMKVHEAVVAARKRGELLWSGVTMHFASKVYDDPRMIFFQRKVHVLRTDTPEILQSRVNKVEHQWQAIITHRVVNGAIRLLPDGTITGVDIE